MKKPSTSAEIPPEISIAERIHAMRVEYLAGLPQKALLMQQAWVSWQTSPLATQAADNLYRIAHNLAGSGATFGFKGISGSSRKILDILAACRESQLSPSTENISTMQAAFARFNAEVAASSVGAAAKPTAMQASPKDYEKVKGEKEAKLIYLVDDDAEFSLLIQAKLQDYGYLVASFESLLPFAAAIAHTLPDAVLMDVMLYEAALAAAESTQALHSQGLLQGIPFIFLSVRDDFEARLCAVRAGASRYLTKPVAMFTLHHTLDLLFHNIGKSSYRVLLVDDDEMMAEMYRSYFEHAGMQLDVLFQADAVLDKLATTPIDLILMDINLPGISGIELGGVIRQFDSYLHIPIVFMTAEHGMDTRLATMQLGADDFLSKPVEPSYLLEVVRTRIERSRSLKSGELVAKKAIHDLQDFKAAEDLHSSLSVTDVQGAIIEVNSKFSEISGYSKQELIGQNHRMLKSGYHPQSFYAEMWSDISSGKGWRGQVKNRKKDGSFYWVDATITPILDEFGVPEKYISVRTDITQIKQIEAMLANSKAELEQRVLERTTELEHSKQVLESDFRKMKQLNQQLEEAKNHLLQSDKMASIGQLAAGVAHEINNPIGYVNSNLGTLEKYVQDLFSMIGSYEQAEAAITDSAVRTRLQAAREKLDFAFLKKDLGALLGETKEGITRVKKIVQNLKDFSHIDAADELHFADLHAGIDSTLNIVNNEIKYKATVIKEYGEIAEVECLASQLNQVFMNLLINAAHAIEENGTITVRTGQQGEEVWVEIADSGTGIPPETLKKIFDPFFTTKPIGKGTGLGLSLSYGIIQKHHGRIEVQSEVGKGTTFRIWLPVRHRQDKE